MKIPTDLKILNLIYDNYYEDFCVYSKDKKRESKIYVPINIAQIATTLEVDNDIVFGRLYYHLNEKYKYKNTDGSSVEFFALSIGNDRHCINFPYLASVLARLREQHHQYLTANVIASVSIIIAISSLIISLLK